MLQVCARMGLNLGFLAAGAGSGSAIPPAVLRDTITGEVQNQRITERFG